MTTKSSTQNNILELNHQTGNSLKIGGLYRIDYKDKNLPLVQLSHLPVMTVNEELSFATGSGGGGNLILRYHDNVYIKDSVVIYLGRIEAMYEGVSIMKKESFYELILLDRHFYTFVWDETEHLSLTFQPVVI